VPREVREQRVEPVAVDEHVHDFHVGVERVQPPEREVPLGVRSEPHLALRDRKRQVVEAGHVAEPFGQVRDLDGGQRWRSGRREPRPIGGSDGRLINAPLGFVAPGRGGSPRLRFPPTITRRNPGRYAVIESIRVFSRDGTPDRWPTIRTPFACHFL